MCHGSAGSFSISRRQWLVVSECVRASKGFIWPGESFSVPLGTSLLDHLQYEGHRSLQSLSSLESHPSVCVSSCQLHYYLIIGCTTAYLHSFSSFILASVSAPAPWSGWNCIRFSALAIISKVPIANPCENPWFSHLRILGESLRKSICESLRILAKACETMNCESLRRLAKHCETIFANLCESLRKPAKSYLRKLAKP